MSTTRFVAGMSSPAGHRDFAIMRYHSDGTLDSGFAANGIATTDFGGSNDEIHSMLVQPDGQIVVAGFTLAGSYDFAVARYNPDGTPDTSFNGTGRTTTSFGSGNDFGWSVALQSDGKIVVAGHAENGSNFAVARYDVDGTLDSTFGAGGKVTTDFGGPDAALSMLITSAGILVGGGGAGDDFALARYDFSGNLDASFGSGGKVVTDLGDHSATGQALVLQGDGKFVLVGQSTTAGNIDFALVRYNTDGSLDTSFGSGGKVKTEFGDMADIAYAATLQVDGKIVAVGTSAGAVAVARYNTDGTLDNTFNGDGKVTTDFGGGFDPAFSVKQQADGKILVSGYTASGATLDVALVRYNSDGSLDTTFGGGLPDQSAFSGQVFNLIVPADHFSDPDGDALTYEALLPNAVDLWLDFDGDTRTFSGTPGEADAGTFNIEIKAMDPGGLYASDIFALVVS